MLYIKVDGHTKIAVQDMNPRGKKTVLLVHGWPLDHTMFEYQTNILPALGIRCVSVDLRGFGQSDMTVTGYTYTELANDIYKVIEHMSLGRFTLAGFSMGGAIALRYMARHRGYRVEKLALLAAAAPSFTRRPDFPYGMSREGMDALIAQAYIDRPQMVSAFGKLFFGSSPSPELREWFTGIGWRASSAGTIQTAYSLRDEDLREDLNSVKVPTGIFHGKLDQVCPYDLALEMKRAIPQAVLYPFERSGHAVFYDELPLFNQLFSDFLLQ